MTQTPASKQTPAVLVLGVVGLVIAGLYSVDRFLARLEEAEVRQEASRLYGKGSDALRRGKAREAIIPLRQAYSMDRANRTYAIGLAEAQLADGQTDAARFVLDDVLRLDSNNGRANLLMARLSTKQGQMVLADSFYHRAIYGAWASDADKQRLDARFELAGLLAEHGTEGQLLAEILMLQQAAPNSTEITKRIARLYLKAQSAARAADAYAGLIRESPADAGNYLGLADAELLRGNFRVAQSAMANALRLRPEEARWKRRAQLVDLLVNLDPTFRRLGAAEKYQRSQQILLMVEQSVVDCFPADGLPQDLKPLVESAKKLRGKQPRGAATNEQSEAMLELAEELWAAKAQYCMRNAGDDDPLPLLMRKIGSGF